MIYFDNNATTPVEPIVLDRMLPFFTEHYGNPSNTTHAMGWAAGEAVEMAREDVASVLSAEPEQITFTSGATEAINMAVCGIVEPLVRAGKPGHLITVATEHKAVLAAMERAAGQPGITLTIIPVDAAGRVTPDDIARALTPETVLTAVMWANNETGTVQPIADIAAVLRGHRSLFLTDATQAVGKLPVSMEGIDMLTLSAHKVYGPKGTGALVTAPRVRMDPLLIGGAQEHGRRAGTLNVPGIVGLGAACQVAAQRLEGDSREMRARRDRFEEGLMDLARRSGIDIVINSVEAERLPQTTNATFRGIKAKEMMAGVGTVAVSTGSACNTGKGAGSHVLKAMGVSAADGEGTVRFSMGRHTTDEEIDQALDAVGAWLGSVVAA
ncbi:MAG: IscS subfamily cysteine desulfurase [Bacteroidetes bacterium CG12_big_fil_rev_8_21_14_0_65_60_17]|nr:MAG: IscS subfamily cysteine desulfurase [Bacteroidetes bacterium CG12_big_fil_rev_8_21_14_0_65_60_17]